VVPCGRAFLAQSLFEPLPHDPILTLWRKAYDSDWQLDACDQTGQVVLRTQLAATTGVRFIGDTIRFDCWPKVCYSGDFFDYGIPPISQGPDYSPEAAGKAVYRATGVQIASLPRPQGYATTNYPFTPTIGMRWEVELLHPVEVRRTASGIRDTTRIFYYVPRCSQYPRPCLLVAQHDQPASYEFTTDIPDPFTGQQRAVTVSLHVRLPLLLEGIDLPPTRPR
jgi:hypothetical protein